LSLVYVFSICWLLVSTIHFIVTPNISVFLLALPCNPRTIGSSASVL
jgi:hypothetical protein